jgi:hypothetical protein
MNADASSAQKYQIKRPPKGGLFIRWEIFAELTAEVVCSLFTVTLRKFVATRFPENPHIVTNGQAVPQVE